MHPSHAYDGFDDVDDDDELPELPIPRPGEERPTPATSAAPIRAPKLGGGASFTASDSDVASTVDGDAGVAAGAPSTATSSGSGSDEARFSWELAARLTQGMLANPARQNVTVKDAMGIFDEFLTEVQTYTRIRTERTEAAVEQRDPDQRRVEHGEYFQAAAKAAAPQPTRIFEPRPDPRITPAITHAPDAHLPPKQQPRPPEGYQSIPPGARYVPGSMSGPSPDTHGPAPEGASDEHAA